MQTANDYYFEAGFGDLGEARNYFIFEVPVFGAPLISAELRMYAGLVQPSNGAAPFELHSVEAYPPIVANHSAYTNVYADLGDGPILGSTLISATDGRRSGYPEWGRLITIPLNAAALEEITSHQGTLVAFGGVVPVASPPALVFGTNPYWIYPQLVLHYASDAAPEVSPVGPDPSGMMLATDRVTLAGLACGKAPLVRQWFKDGEQIPNATNEVLDIPSMTEADAGTYQLVAANSLGIAGSAFVHLDFTPMYLFMSSSFEAFEGDRDYQPYVSVTSRLPVTHQWRRDGVPLLGRTAASLWDYGHVITRDDAGTYDVVVSNDAGSRTSAVVTVTVNLRPPSLFDNIVDTLHIAVGTPLQLSVGVNGSDPMQFQWFRDDEPVPAGNTSLLFLGAAGFSDAGSYYVIVANEAGRATSRVHQVSVEPLVITSLFYDFDVLLLNPFTFYPGVESAVPWTAYWYFNDALMFDQTNQYLKFAAFDYTNSGPYQLVASNAYGIVTSSVMTVMALAQAPFVWTGVQSTKAWVGETVNFSGWASGGPPPAMVWYFNGQPVDPPSPYGTYLQLKNVTTSQSGDYMLVASNSMGVVTSSPPISLTVVAEAPFFVSLPKETNVLAGDFVMLLAKAVAGPPPVYQWRKDGADLPGETNTTLSLGTAQPADAGVYEIVARNESGEARYAHPLRVSSPTGLDRWNWRLPKAQGSRLYQVTWADGRYVASGKSGNVITSVNGVNWTNVLIEADSDLRALAAGNGAIVAAGPLQMPLIQTNGQKFPDGDHSRYLTEFFGIVLVSSNGETWSLPRNPPNDQISFMAFGNGVFVASGYALSGFCYTSVDGRDWVLRELSNLRAYQIMFGNGRFVAQVSDGFLYYSSDGVNWTPTTQPTAYVLAFANGRFLSFQYSGAAYASLDGINWQPLGSHPPTLSFFSIAGGGGAYVAVGALPAGQLQYSTDAVNWRPVDTGTRQDIESVTYVNGQFLGVGEAGTITRSVDGLTWTSDEVANKIDFYGITQGKGLRVAAGDASTILTSGNGIQWTRQSTPSTRNLHAIAYGDGLFVAGGRGGALLTSPNGVTWTSHNSGITNYIERIAWASNLWVAVAEGGAITVSGNGRDWTGITIDGTFFTDNEGVAYGNGSWVVVGGYFNSHGNAVGTAFSSVDGLNWTQRFANAGKRWRDVAFGKGKFVAVGNDGVMAFSTNGVNWSEPTGISNENFRRVHYANGRFVAVGNNGVLLSSPDPLVRVPWTKHRSHTSLNLHDISAAPDGTFVALGNNGMLLQSGDTRPRFLSVRRDGRLEFDAGIAGNLRLERSIDLQSWRTDATNVTSPFDGRVGTTKGFWRLAGD